MTVIKFCGMTREQDIDVACELGIDAVGFVLWPNSPRFLPLDEVTRLVRRLPDAVLPVGVFVNPRADEIEAARAAGIRVAQIHGGVTQFTGEELGTAIWIASSLESDLSALPEGATVLLDANDPERHGGTGRTIDWPRAAEIARRRRVVLAGGLTPANVAQAIARVQPYGVDVASGIEEQPGIKSAQAMSAFVAAAREADQ